MYLVTIYTNDGEIVIHSPYANAVKLIDPTIDFGLSLEVDKFTFQMLPTFPGYSSIDALTTRITVKNTQTDKIVFSGRVVLPKESFSEDGTLFKEITCESEKGYLNDSIQSYYKAQNITPKQFFTHIIQEHNKQVEEHKQFLVGTVEVTNSTDNVYKFIDDTATTYETIKEKCLETFGGEIRIRRGEGVNFIDWLNSSGMNGSQTIELKKNMLSVSRTMDPNEIITILKPRGARIEAPEGETSDVSMPRITIEKVNNGRDYLIDEQKRARFGSIAGSVVWDDVHEPDILLAKAKQWLASQKVSTNQFQISAVDLFPIGLAVDQFEVGNWHVVKNKWLGLDENIRIVGMQLKLNEIEKSTLTFGNKLKTQEQYNADISSAKSAVTTMASGVEQQQANIITINKNVAVFTEDIRAEMNVLQKSFADIFNNFSAMENEFNTFTSIIHEYNQRITALENTINGGSGNGGV